MVQSTCIPHYQMHHINDTLKESRCSSKSQVQQATRCKDAITARITAYVIIICAIEMNHAIVTNTVITTIFTIIIAMCAGSNAMSAMLAMITTTRIVRLIAIAITRIASTIIMIAIARGTVMDQEIIPTRTIIQYTLMLDTK